jgi:hypothetical protein
MGVDGRLPKVARAVAILAGPAPAQAAIPAARELMQVRMRDTRSLAHRSGAPSPLLMALRWSES